MNQPEFLTSFGSAELEYLFLTIRLAWLFFLFKSPYLLFKSLKTPKWKDTMPLGGIGYPDDSFIQFIMINSAPFFSSMLVLAVIARFWFAFSFDKIGKILVQSLTYLFFLLISSLFNSA